MPSKSEPQARFFAACAHGADYPSCPPERVSHEFNQADKGSALLHRAMRHHFATGGANMDFSSIMNNPWLQALIARYRGGNPMARPMANPGRPMMPSMQPSGGGIAPVGAPGSLNLPSSPPPESGATNLSGGPIMGPGPGAIAQARPMGGPSQISGGPVQGMPAPSAGFQMPNFMPHSSSPYNMFNEGGPVGYQLGGPNLAMTPHLGGMPGMGGGMPGVGGGMYMGHARMRMPRIPIADTLRNIDQGLHQTAHIMKPKIPHLAEGGPPVEPQPQLSPQAIAALGMAMAHMQNKDGGSAAGALMSSPEAMKHPHVRAVAHHLRASKDVGPAHKVLSNLLSSLGGGGAGATAAPPVGGKGPPPLGGSPGGGPAMRSGGSASERDHFRRRP